MTNTTDQTAVEQDAQAADRLTAARGEIRLLLDTANGCDVDRASAYEAPRESLTQLIETGPLAPASSVYIFVYMDGVSHMRRHTNNEDAITWARQQDGTVAAVRAIWPTNGRDCIYRNGFTGQPATP